MSAPSNTAPDKPSRPEIQKKRASLSWLKLKKKRPPQGANIQPDGTTQVPNPVTQTSPLLTVPSEILHRIFDFLVEPWSMAIFTAEDEPSDRRHLDETFRLRRIGSTTISVPSGYDLLFVCRGLYHAFYTRLGENCTGRLVLGKIKGDMRRNAYAYLSLPGRQRCNTHIRSISLSFTVGYTKFGMHTRRLFPHVRHADCLVYEGGYGPLLGRWDSIDSFLRGRLDLYLLSKSQTAVNYFIAAHGSSWMAPVSGNSKPWDDEEAVVDVRMLGTSAVCSNAVVGFHYRWEGSTVRIVSRVVWNGTQLSCWEGGQIRDCNTAARDYKLPDQLRWMITSPKW